MEEGHKIQQRLLSYFFADGATSSKHSLDITNERSKHGKKFFPLFKILQTNGLDWISFWSHIADRDRGNLILLLHLLFRWIKTKASKNERKFKSHKKIHPLLFPGNIPKTGQNKPNPLIEYGSITSIERPKIWEKSAFILHFVICSTFSLRVLKSINPFFAACLRLL